MRHIFGKDIFTIFNMISLLTGSSAEHTVPRKYAATVKQQNFIAVNLLHFVKNKILLCLSSSRRQSISLVKQVLLPPGKVS